ncbi:sugar phosphate isomerase/epimerase [Fulvivirga sp. M361]|uniref:sugar phosphate isomerase/epimerase family protein n=1 Tax=Fulvivirga sp. M361 TaxID=2594266 RepID=UPI001C8699A4|nr:sugar phosphate isomerase/epimerase family protein [Fulvivirga sp. M361]
MTVTASLAPFLNINIPLTNLATEQDKEQLNVHIFSKHLQFLDHKTTGQMAAEMGFKGVDLTVRPKGHIVPESVKTALPQAIEDIQKGGSLCEMITTSIESVNNPWDVDVITSAARSGVKYYRTNWFKYIKDRPMTESLEVFRERIKELGDLNREKGIVGCYQNHAGTSIGASFWEVKKILETVDPEFFGTQYDIRHAVAEGGHSWKNGLQLLHSQIKVIVLKDFKWGKVNGKWRAVNVPLGEGMVDFSTYFKLLKKYKLHPPVSLHLEYPLGGAEHGQTTLSVDKKVVFDAMKKDLKTVQKLWQNA